MCCDLEPSSGSKVKAIVDLILLHYILLFLLWRIFYMNFPLTCCFKYMYMYYLKEHIIDIPKRFLTLIILLLQDSHWNWLTSKPLACTKYCYMYQYLHVAYELLIKSLKSFQLESTYAKWKHVCSITFIRNTCMVLMHIYLDILVHLHVHHK